MANTGKKLGYLLEVNKYIDDALVAVSTWNLLNAFTIQGRSYPLITTDELKLYTNLDYTTRYNDFILFIDQSNPGYKLSNIPQGIVDGAECHPTTLGPTTTLIPTTLIPTTITPTTTLGPPVVLTLSPTITGASTAECGGNVISSGNRTVTSRGVCWSTSQNPTITNSKTNNGSGTGIYSSIITGLTPGITYYIRAYAINASGTSYGQQFSINSSAVLPTISTNSITGISDSYAFSGGNITNNGGASISVRGICWSTSQNPTTSNPKTIDGSGSGSFSSYLSGLYSETLYYVRAYAINSAGTAYGNQLSFYTLATTTDEPTTEEQTTIIPTTTIPPTTPIPPTAPTTLPGSTVLGSYYTFYVKCPNDGYYYKHIEDTSLELSSLDRVYIDGDYYIFANEIYSVTDAWTSIDYQWVNGTVISTGQKYCPGETTTETTQPITTQSTTQSTTQPTTLPITTEITTENTTTPSTPYGYYSVVSACPFNEGDQLYGYCAATENEINHSGINYPIMTDGSAIYIVFNSASTPSYEQWGYPLITGLTQIEGDGCPQETTQGTTTENTTEVTTTEDTTGNTTTEDTTTETTTEGTTTLGTCSLYSATCVTPGQIAYFECEPCWGGTSSFNISYGDPAVDICAQSGTVVNTPDNYGSISFVTDCSNP